MLNEVLENSSEAKFLHDKGLTLTPVTLKDTQEIAILEKASYHAADKASPEAIAQRIEEANQFFLVLREINTKRIVGFVNGTCFEGNVLKHESMSAHNPHGTTLGIHSVVIEERLRHQGLALNMLKCYLLWLTSLKCINLVLLLARPPTTELYEKVGFISRGWSQVNHGEMPWQEMELMLC